MLNFLAAIGSAPAGGGGSFESIATVNATGSSVTFSSIPSGFQHLQIRGIYRDSSTSSTQEAPLFVQFNGDGGNNYSQHYMRGNGSSATAVGNASQSWIRIDGAGMVSTSGNFGASIIDVHNYRSTSQNKTLRAIAGSDANISQTNYMISLSSGCWFNTTAVTSITLFAGNGGFVSGSTFALYGIKGA